MAVLFKSSETKEDIIFSHLGESCQADDPVNLQSYVTYVFMELCGYSKAKATELMLQVHNDGKAIVSTGSREEMEHDVARLHEYGLWATLQRGDQI
jgi:ATP-dependent Clp protease adaptor protein ClpS